MFFLAYNCLQQRYFWTVYDGYILHW